MRFGVLGTGVIATAARGYIPGMVKLGSDVILEATCDPVVERARQVQEEFGFKAHYGSLGDMLERSDVDAVVNLTPIPVHGDTCIQILRAGRHVIVEKPIATTMAETDEMIRIAEEKGLTIVAAPPNMLQVAQREARRLIADGAIGKVCFARVRSSHGGPAAGAWPLDPTWFYQEGSGPLFDMGVYGIHDVTGILGPARRVVAFSGITEPIRHVRRGPFQGKEIRVTADDNTLLMLDFGESTFAVVDGTFNVNAARGPRLEVFGRAGTLNVPDALEAGSGQSVLELFKLDAAPGLDGWITPRTAHLTREIERQAHLGRGLVVEHLMTCVRDRVKPVLSAEHARHALEIMLGAIESARAGQVLDLSTTF